MHSTSFSKPAVSWNFLLVLEGKLAHLWLHKHQIYEQYHKVVLDIFVRKALAAGTLCQPDVSTPSSICALGLYLRSLWYIRSGLGAACDVGGGILVSRIRDGRGGRLVVSAVEDVVELRDGIATFDAYWHNASEKNSHMICARWCKWMDHYCREMST